MSSVANEKLTLIHKGLSERKIVIDIPLVVLLLSAVEQEKGEVEDLRTIILTLCSVLTTEQSEVVAEYLNNLSVIDLCAMGS